MTGRPMPKTTASSPTGGEAADGARRQRPGETCRAAPGAFAPRVDLRRCEGKAACVAVCPYGVFEVRRIADADFAALPLLSRLRQMVHGRRVAYTPNAEACRACGLCVAACPERAIDLVRMAG